MKKLKIIADGSIIALANAEKYNQSLDYKETCTWKELNHFLLETNQNNLIVFNTAWDDEWTIGFTVNQENNTKYVRKSEKSIQVTDGKLFLVNWTDLTSTIQFEDTQLPDQTNDDLFLELENGFYKVIIKQLFEHTDEDYDPENTTSYIIELHLQNENPNLKSDHILWTEDFPNDDSSFISNEDSQDLDDILDKIFSEKKD